MPSTDSIAPLYYSSLYRQRVDEKRRLQIPAKWRPANPDTIFTLVIMPKSAEQQACLLVLPPGEFEMLAAKMKAMGYGDAKTNALRRIIGVNSDHVSLDKSGRIVIPEEMAKAVGVEKEAVLVGMLDRFEIWNPENYAVASATDNELAQEAFKLI